MKTNIVNLDYLEGILREKRKKSNPVIWLCGKDFLIDLIDIDNRDLMILYQNQTMPAIEILQQNNNLFTITDLVQLRDKLVQDILLRCKE